jgi:tRNA (cytidine/uridine-2'-O-)-methyltransferase
LLKVATTAKRTRQVTALQHTVFTPDDSLIFGSETRGLPAHVLEQCGLRVHIPIRDEARSLNMSTAAGIVLYAALSCLGALPALSPDQAPAGKGYIASAGAQL